MGRGDFLVMSAAPKNSKKSQLKTLHKLQTCSQVPNTCSGEDLHWWILLDHHCKKIIHHHHHHHHHHHYQQLRVHFVCVKTYSIHTILSLPKLLSIRLVQITTKFANTCYVYHYQRHFFILQRLKTTKRSY